MKKLLYGVLASGFLLTIGSCGGQKEYDSYVATLRQQPAIIDTLSSAKSYADYLDSLTLKANNFEALDIKLNETQQDELEGLSAEIQAALTKTYNRIAQTPMLIAAETLPADSIAPGKIEMR